MQVTKDIEAADATDVGSTASELSETGRGQGSMSRRASREELEVSKVPGLIEQMVERANMQKAYSQVMRNGGVAGIDKMTCDKLKDHLKRSWVEIKEDLLIGRYKPQPVRRVEIPKPDGGKRLLGIPTVTDRLIQQALHQVMSPIFDPSFSDHSYGFRVHKSAHQAVKQARAYQETGRRWVVDMDLAKFFDEVNHDLLMARIAMRVEDKRVLKLIRGYLQAGISEGGQVTATRKGTPQGGPLSPLLSNIMLNDLDKELTKRGHSFCRYADDCNIYVKTKRSGERVMTGISWYVETKLKLKVNREKSAVARPWQRKFLGYTFTWHLKPKMTVAKKSIQRFKAELKARFRSGRGQNIGRFVETRLNPLIIGWTNYFKLAETKQFAEELDGWIRHRLRTVLWRQWKRPRTRQIKLIKAGLSEERAKQSAYNGRGPWWNAGKSHMNEAFPKKFFDSVRLVSLLDTLLKPSYA